MLSQCDVDALADLFAWALAGDEPPGPGPGLTSYDATFVC